MLANYKYPSILLVVGLVIGTATTLAYCQEHTRYQLTKDDLSRMQERAEALRVAGESGWEQAYIAIARNEWASEERTLALSRFILTMQETQSCEWRTAAFHACHKLITAAAIDHRDTKEYKQQLEDFSLHSKKILLEVPLTQDSMANGCATQHASALAAAAQFWEGRDQGAAEKASEAMLEVAAYQSQIEGDQIRSDANLMLARIHEARGKYEQAYTAYDAAYTASDFSRLGADGALARQLMLTERVRLLALYQPGLEQTRTAITARASEIRSGTLPWSERVDLFIALHRTLQIEGMTDERIEGLMHFVQTAPAVQIATQEQEASVQDLLSRLQGASHASVGRPDAALFAFDVLMERTSDLTVRDRYAAQRAEIAAQMH